MRHEKTCVKKILDDAVSDELVVSAGFGLAVKRYLLADEKYFKLSGKKRKIKNYKPKVSKIMPLKQEEKGIKIRQKIF